MRKFGLIGYPLTHSFSQSYFTQKFAQEGIDAAYDNFPIPDIGQLRELLTDPLLEGINVTIPHKESVLPFLDDMAGMVNEIRACNCIRIRDGRLTGFNTDVAGFEKSLSVQLASSHNKALVLGTGGASKAVCYVLRQKGIPFLQVSRRGGGGVVTYEELNQELVADHPLIINTTPLGMHPDTGSKPQIPYAGIHKGHYLYDLVYNPSKTAFLAEGERRGALIENGYRMLIIQAEESWKIWNS